MTERTATAPALLAAFLSFLLFAAAIPGPYIYDDVSMIHDKDSIHSLAEWKNVWTESYNGGADNLYRPLASETYAVQWWINGDRPWAFRLVNILLHAAVAAAVAMLASRLAGAKVAYAAGLLFAAHPVHVEAVIGIVGRAEELCALFTLSGLILFLHRPLTPWRAVAIAGCGIAAMLAKEQGMLFPFLLLSLSLCTRRKPDSPRERQAMQWLTLALCVSLSGLIVLREQVLNLRFEWDKVFLDTSIQPLARSTAAERAGMVFVLLGHYAQLMIVPWRLSIDYGQAVLGKSADLHDPYLYLGLLTAAGGIALLAAEIRAPPRR